MSMQLILDLLSLRAGSSREAQCWDAGQRMPMSALRARAEGWAVALRGHGIRPGAADRVLVLLPRSVDLLTAHLAVFLAGGLPVIVDPAYPAERIADTVAFAQPVVLISAAGAAGAQEGGIALTPAELDGAGQARLGSPRPIDPQDAAYVIYTSGTTGHPKGVVVEWGGFAGFLSWHLDYVGVGPSDRLSLTNSPGFDVSVWEHWVALVSGADVHICSDDDRLDPRRLQRAWIEHEITSSFLATPLMERLLAVDWPAGEHAPRVLLTGGDRLRRRPRPDAPFTLLNAYGPSECCPCVTISVVEPETPENAGTLPDIGKPLPLVQAHILDDQLRPVPDGEQGRLWIGGKQVGRGYLDDPAGTAARFRPDPSGAADSARIYDTGDLVTRLPDGRMAFHGRDDDQVKIDGVRIELADVESVIARHPAVLEAIVVVLRVPGLDADRLCCAVVPRDGSGEEIEAELAELAKRSLPRAMVPVDIMTVPAVPVTTNGKRDRRLIARLHAARLSARLAARLAARSADALAPSPGQPHDDVTAVVAIWQEVLGQEVTADSDFWSLGANSLQAAQIAGRIGAATGRDCPPSRVLLARTPRALAKTMLTLPAEIPVSGTAVSEAGPWRTSSMQRTMWYLSNIDPASAVYNVGATFVLGVQADLAALRSAVTQLVGRQPALRSRFSFETGQNVLHQYPVDPPRADDILTVRQASSAPEALAIATEHYRLPYDLAAGPLFRVLYVPVADGGAVLQFASHHIVIDGLSLTFLLQEFAALYEGRAAGPPSGAGVYPVWQQQQAQRPQTQAFWSDRAPGIRGCAFPTPLGRRPDPAAAFPGGISEVISPPGLGSRLEEFAAAGERSRYSVMLAAWFLTLARYCDQAELSVGVPFHGRTRPEFSADIGMFANALPVSVAVGRYSTFDALLAAVDAEVTACVEHGDLALSDIAQRLPGRTAVGANIIGTTFNEKFHFALLVDRLLSRYVEMDPATSRFDLSAFLHVTGDLVSGHLEWSADHFNADAARDIAAAYFAILRDALSRPQARLDTLGVAERAVRPGPAPLGEPPLGAPPLGEPALWCGPLTRTAAEVTGAAAGLAAVLAARLETTGTGAPAVVALRLDNSASCLIAALACRQAGAPFLELPPGLSQGEIADLFREAGVGLIVTRDPGGLPNGPWQALSPDEVTAGHPQPAFPAHAPAEDADRIAAVEHIPLQHGWMARTGRSLAADIALLRMTNTSGLTVAAATGTADLVCLWEAGARLVLPETTGAVGAVGAAGALAAASHGADVVRLRCEQAADYPLPAPGARIRLDLVGDRLPAEALEGVERPAGTGEVLWFIRPPLAACTVAVAPWSPVSGLRPALVAPDMDILVVDQQERAVPAGCPGTLFLGQAAVPWDFAGDEALAGRALVYRGRPGAARPLVRTEVFGRVRADGRVELLERAAAEVTAPAATERPDLHAHPFEATAVADTELAVLAAMGRVLRQELIDPATNFFELGGDSVMALQLVNELAAAGLRVSLRELFELGSAKRMAARLDGRELPAGPAAPPRPAAAPPRPAAGPPDGNASAAPAAGPPDPDAAVTPGADLMPLTPLQSVLVFENLRSPDSDAYWLAVAYELAGDWAADRLRDAWAQTVRTNPVLRTQFVRGEGVLQTVGGSGPELTVTSWAQLRDTHLTARHWVEAELEQARQAGVFDSLRASVLLGYQGAPGDEPRAVLAVTQHHLAADGWSLVQVLNDFFAAVAGRPAPAERPSVAAYHSWVRASGAIERGKVYWTRQLAGIEPALPLQFGQDTAADAKPDLRVWDVTFPVAAGRALADFSRRHRLSQAAVMTYLWSRLLCAYQEGGELCVGMTYSGRPDGLPESGDISGMLINTLPLRLPAGRSFLAGCEAAMAAMFDGAENAHLSYGEAVACAGLPGLTRLFQSTVIFENFAGRLAEVGHGFGLPANPRLIAEIGTSADPLSLTVDLREDGMVARLGWDEAQFDGTVGRDIVRRLGHWLERLDELACDGSEPQLLTTEEVHAWRRRFEQAAEPAPWDLAGLIAAADPAAVAIRDGEAELSYAELLHAVGQAAAWLKDDQGVTAGSEVALIGGRSAWGAVAIMAVWALGAAWCPVAAKSPPAHRRRLLEVLRPDAVIDVADLAAAAAGHDPVDPGAWAVFAPGDTAYFVATSGSTGAPKIVALSAGGLAPLVSAWHREYGSEPKCVLQIGSWAADVFLGDLLKAVTTQGCLTIVPDGLRTDLDHLADLIVRHRVTFAESTPQLLGLLLRRLRARGIQPDHLSTLVAGSDTFREQERTSAIGLLWPGARLVNGYGLSEATIESLVFDCSADHVSSSGLCPVGVPLSGVAVRIVDPSGRQVPRGAVGELWVGGPGVATGYRTAQGTDTERFPVVDGIRWLRTADRAVASATGVVEFLGRSDSTVKVRGHRVELGAVEDALLRLPGVSEAAALAIDDRLVAFVSGSPALTPAVIIGHAREVLPAEAVPSLVAVLDRLPRNANQKTDRTQLAARAAEAQPAAPAVERADSPAVESALTATMTSIWTEVLGRRAHRGQTFFDQGGHSLLALKLLERLQRDLPGDAVDITDLFRYPTIDSLCAELQRRRSLQPVGAP